MHGAQRVLGVLVLFKPLHAPDFDLRQVRIVELLARRVAFILMNAYDPTTGLLTRPAFEKRAHVDAARQATSGNHCVIYVDIDRLHVLNENLGMHVGDEVIVRVAEAIRRSVTPRMLASRISGDRFALMLPDATVDQAQDLAERLRDALEQLGFIRDRQTVDITASFGIAARARAATTRCRTRSPRPRSRARRRRTAAATGSRSTPTATRASCAATPTSRWSARCARRCSTSASGSRRSRSCRSTAPRATPSSSCCCA